MWPSCTKFSWFFIIIINTPWLFNAITIFIIEIFEFMSLMTILTSVRFINFIKTFLYNKVNLHSMTVAISNEEYAEYFKNQFRCIYVNPQFVAFYPKRFRKKNVKKFFHVSSSWNRYPPIPKNKKKSGVCVFCGRLDENGRKSHA